MGRCLALSPVCVLAKHNCHSVVDVLSEILYCLLLKPLYFIPVTYVVEMKEDISLRIN